jgi:hypothetical protein
MQYEFFLTKSVLPEGFKYPDKYWDSKLLVWGDDEHNDVKAWMQNERCVESIAIRLDLRDNLDKFINDITSVAKIIDCVLFIPETKQIIEPSHSQFMKSLRIHQLRALLKTPSNI